MYKIYGTPTCGFCTRAKQAAQAANIDFEYIDLTEDDAAMHKIAVVDGHRTVPQIYFDTGEGWVVHIGGYEEFQMELEYLEYVPDNVKDEI